MQFDQNQICGRLSTCTFILEASSAFTDGRRQCDDVAEALGFTDVLEDTENLMSCTLSKPRFEAGYGLHGAHLWRAPIRGWACIARFDFTIIRTLPQTALQPLSRHFPDQVCKRMEAARKRPALAPILLRTAGEHLVHWVAFEVLSISGAERQDDSVVWLASGQEVGEMESKLKWLTRHVPGICATSVNIFVGDK